MPPEILVDKAEFDRLLTKMLNSPPLPKSEIKVAKPKPNGRRGVKKSVAVRGGV
jgi:hypothetical protein